MIAIQQLFCCAPTHPLCLGVLRGSFLDPLKPGFYPAVFPRIQSCPADLRSFAANWANLANGTMKGISRFSSCFFAPWRSSRFNLDPLKPGFYPAVFPRIQSCPADLRSFAANWANLANGTMKGISRFSSCFFAPWRSSRFNLDPLKPGFYPAVFPRIESCPTDLRAFAANCANLADETMQGISRFSS